MEKVKFIYLDVGDTLIHLKIPPGKIYYEVLRAHNVIETYFDESLLKKYFTESWQAMNKKNPPGFKCRYTNHKHGNEGFWKELVELFLSNFEKAGLTDKVYLDIVDTFNDPDSWEVDESFFDLREAAAKMDTGLGIISNWDIRLRTLLNKMRLSEYFTNIIISSEFGYEKPSEKIFNEGMRQAKLGAESLVYAGDKPEFDYHTPKSLGWSAYLISSKKSDSCESVKNLGELANKVYGSNL